MVCVVVVLLLGVGGWVTANEVRVDTGFDRAHRSLDVTRDHLRLVRADVASVQAGLHEVDGQVDLDSATLSRDTTQLQGLETALADSRRQVSSQTSTISALQVCLDGVQRALNALSVGDQAHAITAFDAVASSCNAAVNADA